MKNRIKRCVAFFLLLVWMLTPWVNASETDLIVRADPVIAEAGERFSVQVQILGRVGLRGFSLSFSYDSSVLTPVCVTKDDRLVGFIEDSIETSNDNTFKVVWCGSDDLILNGPAFSLVFETSRTAFGESTLAIDYDKNSTFNANWQDVTLITENISIQIQNGSDLPRLSVENAVVSAGELYDCSVGIENAKAGNPIQITVLFDPAVMVPLSVSDGLARVESYTSGNSGIAIRCSVLQDWPEWTTLFTIRFQTIREGQGVFSVRPVTELNWPVQSGTLTIKTSTTGNEELLVASGGTAFVEGTILNVPIYLNNNSGVMGFHLRIPVAPSLELVSCIRGEALSSGNFDYRLNEQTRALDVLWNDSRSFMQNGELFVLRFQISDERIKNVSLPMFCIEEGTFDEQWKSVKMKCEQISIAINKLDISPKQAELQVGDRIGLSAVLVNGTKPMTTVCWVSQNERVATVEQDGTVTAHHRGTVTITGSDENGNVGSIALTVVPADAKVEIVSKENALAKKIPWWSFYVSANMELDMITEKCDEAVWWTWSSNSTKVKVNQNGHITNQGLFARCARITVAGYNDEGDLVAQNSCMVYFFRFNWQLILLMKYAK